MIVRAPGTGVLAAAGGDVAAAFVELGLIALGLAALARVSLRAGISPIPAYLVAGLLFGEGGIVEPRFTQGFIEMTAEIGVILLLLTLGLEYSAGELAEGLRTGWRDGLTDLALNATPGAIAGYAMGWGATGAAVTAGITYISSSGVVAKVLADLGRLGNRETPAVLTVLVIEDLAMAAYLPVITVVLAGEAPGDAAVSVAIALAVVAAVLVGALRFGHHVTRALSTPSDEGLLLGVLGLTLLVGGVAQQLDVSAAIGAFLVGIAVSGPVQARAAELVRPLRDLFAAVFFLLFGLRIDPGDLPPVLTAAAVLAVVTAATKVVTGWRAAARLGVGARGRMRAGTALVARGEFSIVIAGLAASSAVDADLLAFAAAYVLVLAAAGPVLARFADRLGPAGPPAPRR